MTKRQRVIAEEETPMLSDIGGRRPTPTAYNSQPPRPKEGDNSNLTMTDTEVLNTFKTAEKNGGSFMTHLARAGIAADPTNRALILRTWPEIYTAYGPGNALYEEGL